MPREMKWITAVENSLNNNHQHCSLSRPIPTYTLTSYRQTDNDSKSSTKDGKLFQPWKSEVGHSQPIKPEPRAVFPHYINPTPRTSLTTTRSTGSFSKPRFRLRQQNQQHHLWWTRNHSIPVDNFRPSAYKVFRRLPPTWSTFKTQS